VTVADVCEMLRTAAANAASLRDGTADPSRLWARRRTMYPLDSRIAKLLQKLLVVADARDAVNLAGQKKLTSRQ